MDGPGFFNNPNYRYRFTLRANRNHTKLPDSTKVIQHSEEMQNMAHFNSKLILKRKIKQTITDQLNDFTKTLNHRYTMNQKKAFAFEDSALAYTSFLADPNIESNEIALILNHIYDRYLFREYPEVIGCLIGRLLIYCMFNPDERPQINRTIDKIYELTKRSRNSCDMSKIMHLTLLDMWNRWGITTTCWVDYAGWDHFRKVQDSFWKLSHAAKDQIRQIWIEFGLNQDKHEVQVVQLLRRMTDYRDLTVSKIVSNFFCLIFLLNFILDEHKNVKHFSDELIKTLSQILSKVCYLPLNPWFYHMNAFLMLYKLVVKERDILGDVVLKLHMVLRATPLFFKRNTQNSRPYIIEFKEKINRDPEFTQHYNKLDKELEHVVQLRQMVEKPSQFFSYGEASPSQRKESYQQVFKTLHSQLGKISESQARICRSLIRAKPQILSYAQKKLANLDYIELYLTLNKIHQSFMCRMKQMCELETSIEQRHKHVKYLYTWFSGAYLLIMKQMNSQENLLLKEGFLSRQFVQQMHSELISRIAELGIVELDFRKVYGILFEEYSIDDVVVLDFKQQGFAVREIFEAMEKMGWNVGNATSFYELLKLRAYFNTCVTKSYGLSKDPKKQQIRQEMRRVVQGVLRKKEMMMNRPEKKFVKTGERPEPKQQADILEVFKMSEDLKYPVYYDGQHHLIKSTIFMILDKMRDFGMVQQKDYCEIFMCIVTVLDSEKLLLEIYANMMFTVLGSGDKKLTDWGYQKLNLIRKSLSEKWRYELPCTQFTIDGMLCIYERLRKIQIKKERWKSNKSKSVVSIDKSSGKSKLLKQEEENIAVEQSKIYKHYFEYLFEGAPYEVLSYGKQLAKLGKHREAVYVLENVNEKLKRQQLKEQLDVGQEGEFSVDRKELQVKNIECDIALCNCYAVLVPSFNEVQERTRKLCIEKRIRRLQQSYPTQSFTRLTSIMSTCSQPPNPRLTLISQLTSMIKQQYAKNHMFYNKNGVIKKDDIGELHADDINFQFMVYGHITNYSMHEITKLNTREEFRIYYHNVVIGALLHEWYKERKSALIIQAINRLEGKHELQAQDQTLPWDLPSCQKKQQTYNLPPEGQTLQLSFDDILRSSLPLVTNPTDCLAVMQTAYYIEQLDKNKRLQTIRMHNQAILEANKMRLIFDMFESCYGGENYEQMTLFQLETLQRYYFEKGSYQHVKAITKSMLEERQQQLYSEKPVYHISWPQVFCYDLQAKLYDDNLSSDSVVASRWHEFLKLIQHDMDVVVEGKKVGLELLSDPNYLKEMRLKQPSRHSKIKHQLQSKIHQYLKLLRIIFDNIELQCKISINIFLVLQRIYERFFIKQLVPASLYVDFFFYYLRFLCEGVNCEWFEIEGEAQFANGMQPVELDKSSLEIRVEHMNKIYVVQRTANVVVMLLENLEWVKGHFLYLTRAFDEQKNTKKNFIIKKILVQTVAKNPPEHIWNLTLLKHYTLKFPYRHLDNRPSIARTHKFQQRNNFSYEQDSILNKRHDSMIREVYEEIIAKVGEVKIDSLIEIPEMLIEILEVNACEKAMRVNFSFQNEDNVAMRVKDINSRIKQSSLRIPYPLDSTFYIKSLNKFSILGNGKSVPTNFDFSCRPFAEVKGDVYRKEKNAQMTVDDSYKSFIMKYNFSREDFMVETATANFYNEIGMLDREITYKIVNLSKYMLMIEKIHVKHCTMYELLEKACGIEELDSKAVQNARNHDVRCTRDQQVCLTPGFYDLTKVQRHNPLLQNNQISLFKYFYKEGLRKRHNIDEWWKHIDNFIRTLAQWSYLSYLTKLGDRHNSNILVTDAGKLIHIDYEYNFAHGLMLAYPEWVPFRLTEAFVSVLGTFQERGTFYGYFLEMARKFDPSEEKTWKALGNFQPEQRKIVQSSATFSRFHKGLSLEERCEQIIDTSRSDALLRLMYRGWLSCV